MASLYRLPPACRFFEKWTPKNTSFGVVVQVASGGFIFSKQRPFFYMEALAAVSRRLRRFYVCQNRDPFFKTRGHGPGAMGPGPGGHRPFFHWFKASYPFVPVSLENGKSLEINKKTGFGQSSLPKWVLRTIEFIWVLEFPLSCHDKMISSQNHFFRDLLR